MRSSNLLRQETERRTELTFPEPMCTLHIVCVRPATPRRHSDHSPRTVHSVAGACCSDLLELFSGALL